MIIYLYTKFQSNTPILSIRYRTETIFQSWKFFKVEKGHNSQNNWWIVPLIELGLHFMIIYLCIKFQSNTPILSKDIAWKPKVLRTGRMGQDGTGWTDVHMDSRGTICTPHWKWRRHKHVKKIFVWIPKLWYPTTLSSDNQGCIVSHLANKL